MTPLPSGLQTWMAEHPEGALLLAVASVACQTLLAAVAATLIAGAAAREAVVAAAGIGLVLAAEAGFAAVRMRRAMRAARPWLEGTDGAAAAADAWGALARLPRMAGDRTGVLAVFLAAVLSAVAVGATAGRGMADLPALAVVAALSILLALLRFLGAEFALRPVLRRVSDDLAPRAPLADVGVSLRLRLLITLLAMNVMTALIVGTAASGGGGGASGTGILVAVGAGLLCSLGVSLLLARSVVEPILELRDAADRVTGGVLDAQAPVLAGDETGELAVSLNRMLVGLRERAGLRHYVPGEVADRLAAEGGRLPAEEVDLTVVFLDVRGFTALSERVTGAELAGRLNGLFERIVPIIERHGGHANKFVGDGLLAVFGSPRPLEHHADAAVAAVLEIIGGAPGDELPLCAGVNSGYALVATIGGGARLDFTVLGDVVNTAARVQAATRETGDPVLITEAVVERLSGGAAGWAARPPMVLRGKALPVRLFGYTAWRRRGACDRYSQVGMFMGRDPAPREDTWT